MISGPGILILCFFSHFVLFVVCVLSNFTGGCHVYVKGLKIAKFMCICVWVHISGRCNWDECYQVHVIGL